MKFVASGFNSACFFSNLDHPGLVRLIAAHARPPGYLLFFEFYEAPNLAEKLHVEEWNPTTDEVLIIAFEIGMIQNYAPYLCFPRLMWSCK